MKFKALALALTLSANLNAQGFSSEQLAEIKAMMNQTKEIAKEQNMGEDILNNQTQDINAHTQNNMGINPFGIYDRGSQQVSNPNQINQATANNYNGYDSQSVQISKEELELMQNAMKNQDLNALQKKFFNKNYSGYENTQELEYEPNKTNKIVTRQAMATTLIFSSPIDSFILGDTSGFNAQQINNQPNAIVIKPRLIGIDTNLTIFTMDGKMHTFYIYSTNYKNKKDPAFVIYIKDAQSIQAQKQKEEEINKDYLVIKDGISELLVKKDKINHNYEQMAKKENEWLKSQSIFSDDKFTYFYYPKDKMPKLPTIYAVIDKQDSPVETRVIGDYIIAETINPKFSIKSGNSYVCVAKGNAKETLKSNSKTQSQSPQEKRDPLKELDKALGRQ